MAEDLVQETFISALQGLDRFKGGSAVRTWLVGILKHKIIDYYRKSSREVFSRDLGALRKGPDEEVVDRLIGAITPPAHEWKDTPHKLLENKQFWDVFTSCLDGLTPAFRSAFTMRELDGMGTEEICKILDITPTNLWVILHRARAKLRGCLEAKWFGDGQSRDS